LIKFGRQILTSPIPASLKIPNINIRDNIPSQQSFLPKLETFQNPSLQRISSCHSMMRSSLPSTSLFSSNSKGEQKRSVTPDKMRSSTPDNKISMQEPPKILASHSSSRLQSPKAQPNQSVLRDPSPKNQIPQSLPPITQTRMFSPVVNRRTVSPMSSPLISPQPGTKTTSENPSTAPSPSYSSNSVLTFFDRVRNEQNNLEFVYCKISGGIYDAFNPYNMVIVPYTNVGSTGGVQSGGGGFSNAILHSTKIVPLLGKKYITASVKVLFLVGRLS
jgi:hypothetical protein